jgi:signal transduction histidine kinase
LILRAILQEHDAVRPVDLLRSAARFLLATSPTTRTFAPLSTQTAAIGSHLSIFSKGLLLITAPVIFQLALLLVVRDVQMAARNAQNWAGHSREVLVNADEVSRLIIQLVATERGAVLAGNPQFDAESRPNPEDIIHRLDDLKEKVGDSAEQVQRVEDIRRAALNLEEWIAGEQTLLTQGRAEEAAQRVRSGEGTRRSRRVRDAMTIFLEEETRLGDQRDDAVVAAEARERRVTVIGAIVTLFLAIALVYLFTRSIAGRLAIVSENADRLAAGASLQTPVAGTDEIAQLDRILHQTAGRLTEAANAAARAKAEVDRQNEELALVNSELAQKTQENELFIYSVSHDLRSPLVNLTGFSKELTRACADLGQLLHGEGITPQLRAKVAVLTDQEIPESVHFIKTAVARASLIIDALLRLSRAGRVEYRWQMVPVQTVVSNILDAMRAAINERKAEVIVHPLGEAWGDPVAVEQIFANLIGNAVNYLDPTRPGRIEIGMIDMETLFAQFKDTKVYETEPPVLLRDDPEAYVVYYVKDNGLGIPAGSLDKVFVAFQRLHARAARGEGIGLALVRRIVDRHHGEIWVNSTEGAGSTFYVQLPNAEPEAQPAATVIGE